MRLKTLSPLIHVLSPLIGRTPIDGYPPFKGISIDRVRSFHPLTIDRGDFRSL
jgi:hypothetical protein